jgi:DNA-binding CsgD family transcriptional regulator
VTWRRRPYCDHTVVDDCSIVPGSSSPLPAQLVNAPHAGTPASAQYYRRRGIVDGLGINGLDPTRRGCCVVLFFGTAGRIDEPDRQRWSRAATHLAAGYRLRRRLERSNDGADVEAVLTPNGRVEHATGEARATSARTVLRDAVVCIEQARRAQGGERGDAALDDWRGLTAARWSLVEQIEHDGRRYLLARRNDVDSPGPAALSPRERQVLAFAALGRTNKVIAYDLGLAVSTVGVLVSRAMRKLEVRTRAAAIAVWNVASEKSPRS